METRIWKERPKKANKKEKNKKKHAQMILFSYIFTI